MKSIVYNDTTATATTTTTTTTYHNFTREYRFIDTVFGILKLWEYPGFSNFIIFLPSRDYILTGQL